MMGDRCEHCPALPDEVCPNSLWRSGCRVAKTEPGPERDWLLASAERQLYRGRLRSTGKSDVDLKLLIKVECCPHRWSSCGCTGKPAVCLRENLPMPTNLKLCEDCLAVS